MPAVQIDPRGQARAVPLPVRDSNGFLIMGGELGILSGEGLVYVSSGAPTAVPADPVSRYRGRAPRTELH